MLRCLSLLDRARIHQKTKATQLAHNVPSVCDRVKKPPAWLTSRCSVCSTIINIINIGEMHREDVVRYSYSVSFAQLGSRLVHTMCGDYSNRRTNWRRMRSMGLKWGNRWSCECCTCVCKLVCVRRSYRLFRLKFIILYIRRALKWNIYFSLFSFSFVVGFQTYRHTHKNTGSQHTHRPTGEMHTLRNFICGERELDA